MTALVLALLESGYAVPVVALTMLACVAVGAGLGATWDRLTTRARDTRARARAAARARLTPTGAHRR